MYAVGSRWHLGKNPRPVPKLCQCKNINAHDPRYLLSLQEEEPVEFFFEFISKESLQLVNFIFLSESTIVDGISETFWQQLYLVTKWKIALEEGII